MVAERALRLTPAAERDLNDIWTYSETTWGRAQAERYIDAIFGAFDRIRAMPDIARLRNEFTPPVRILPSGRHLVIYLADDTTVDVIRILGARQDWAAMLARLDD